MRRKRVTRPLTAGVGLWMVAVVLGLAAAEAVGREVDWTGPGGSRIRGVRMRPEMDLQAQAAPLAESSTGTVSNVIDSPPIDGFVPWIVVTTTDRSDDPEIAEATAEWSYVGVPTPMNPQTDYVIGIFDTGASAHVFGYASAMTLGLWNTTYLTDHLTTISGVTGSVDAWVSQPLGVFIGGLDLLDPNGTSPVIDPPLADMSGLIGESNVAVIVGDYPGSYPDLATAIGSPMSVFYTAHIRNDLSLTVEKNGKAFSGPSIRFFEDPADPAIPSYPIRVPLELRPLGALSVQYMATDIEEMFELGYSTPTSPSIIIGTSSQSLFFVHSVDMTEGTYSAIDKGRFMLDTGAQVTVIGSRVAARLGLDSAHWDFQVDIEGVTGEVTQAPGFVVDSLKIPAMGGWLEFTNVPVVLLDIFSPEGGTLDGIIGMNLFTEYNLVLRGGGLFLQDDPMLELQRIVPLTADLAPEVRDGQVDLLDFAVLGRAWQSTDGSAGWNAEADLAVDSVINLQDLTVFCEQWLLSNAF